MDAVLGVDGQAGGNQVGRCDVAGIELCARDVEADIANVASGDREAGFDIDCFPCRQSQLSPVGSVEFDFGSVLEGRIGTQFKSEGIGAQSGDGQGEQGFFSSLRSNSK
ncbi:hypothetical protein ACFS3C_07710 [Azotobacter vinelandii]